jgi:hypothetical protein
MARQTELADFFAKPQLLQHRRYEICRAYFLERLPAARIARQFGLAVDTVRALVRDFAADPVRRHFFVETPRGRRPRPSTSEAHQRIRQLRQQGLALGPIVQQLAREGRPLSPAHVGRLLRADGFPRLPRGGPGPLPGERAQDGSEVPAIADVKALNLCPHQVLPAQVPGLFLFVPDLLALHVDEAVTAAGYPGSQMIPPTQAILALLAGKLLGKRRISHIDDLSFDPGAGLFAGLNVLPKTTYATDYSYRTQRSMNERFVDALMNRLPGLDHRQRRTFYLDFHAIPYRGDEAVLEQHWVPQRNKATPSVMAFVAQEAERRIVCYATANIVRREADTLAVRFADHWKQTTGHYPARVILDSRATVYPGLSGLNQRGIGFITVRRRGAAMLKQVAAQPSRAWQRCEVVQAGERTRRVQYLDQTVSLPGYDGCVRQLVIQGLGHEKPTFLLTNDRPRPLSARQVIMDYARRNLVEHNLGEKITFFHIDCLTSEVRLNVDFDLALTVAAHLVYQTFAQRLKGFETSTPATLFRKFTDTPGRIDITESEVCVRFDKRSHNPILKEAHLDRPTAPIPWWGGRRLHMSFP